VKQFRIVSYINCIRFDFDEVFTFYKCADKKLTFQFIKHFENFIKQNPGALWQPQLLQQKLMKANLGKTYWDNKIEQYRVIRQQMGISLR
jgi:hypothetical protein